MNNHRIYNWDYHLVSYASSLIGKEFSWGDTDCGSITRRCIDIMYDGKIDLRIEEWSTKSDALKTLVDFNVVDYFQSIGAVQVELTYLRGGDIVVFDIDTFSLGVCINSYQILMSDESLGPRVIGTNDIPIKHVLRFPDGNKA